VLATAIRSVAVKAVLVMIPLSSKMLTKIIMMSALVCSSQPITQASSLRHLRTRLAILTPRKLADDRSEEQQAGCPEYGEASDLPARTQSAGGRLAGDGRHHRCSGERRLARTRGGVFRKKARTREGRSHGGKERAAPRASSIEQA